MLQYDSPLSSTELSSNLQSNTNISSATLDAIESILNLGSTSNIVVAGGTVTPQNGTATVANTANADAVLLNIDAQAGEKVQVVIPTEVLASSNLYVFDTNADLSVEFNTVERVIVSGNGNDVLKVGGDKDTVLDGAAGNDTLISSGGNDSISGGEGNDTIVSGNGNDTIDGGAGNDWLVGGNGTDTFVLGNLSAGQADTIVDFGKGALSFSQAQLETLKLGGKTLAEQTKNLKVGSTLDADNSLAVEGNKLLVDLNGDGTADYTTEFAGSSKLALKFSAKNDEFVVKATASKTAAVGTATTGADTLVGTKKADVLVGEAGNDVLIGSAGKDVYEWSNADLNAGGFDVVVDDKGSKLDLGDALAALDLKVDGSVLADLSKGKVKLGTEINAENSVAFKNGALQVDLNGDGVFDNTNDFKIEIVGTVKGVIFNAKSDTFDLI